MFVRGLLSLCLLVSAAACGDDGGGGAVDAPNPVDTKASIMEVVCPATPAATFTTDANSFMPQTASITVGQTVKFESNSPTHPIGPMENDPLSDRDLVVAGGQTKCFKFLTAGKLKFICTQHRYVGTITAN